MRGRLTECLEAILNKAQEPPKSKKSARKKEAQEDHGKTPEERLNELFEKGKKTGKLTVRKGLKKGNYKVKIKVTAAGDEGHNKATGTATARIRVK